MTAATQHDFHPDAEMLNAFAEQALPERERSQVLAHLAVCGRCRQVLAFAQPAIGAEAVELEEVALPAAAAPAPPPPSAWWRRWRLVWVPAGVLATFIVTSLSIYLWQVDDSNKTVVVETQPAAPNLNAVAASSQDELAKVASPPSPPVATTPARPPAQTRAAMPETTPAPLPAAPDQQMFDRLTAGAATPRSVTQTVTVEQNQSSLAPVSPAQQPETAQLAPAGLPAVYGMQLKPLSPEQQQMEAKRQLMLAEQRKQIEAAAVQNQMFTGGAAQPSGAQGAIAGAAAGANSSAASTNQQTELRARSTAGFSQLHGSLASWNGSLQPIHLPSGLAVASLASAAHRAVAIDTAGTVFVSEDSRGAWKSVKPQWAGRAILVRTHTPSLPASKTAPAAATGDSTSAAVRPAPNPASFFEIVNDKNQIWQSTDGTTWTAK